MTSVQLLLLVLARDPADDAAWLALADALEEEGKVAQAEATRLGLQLRSPFDPPERPMWENRQRELLFQGVRVALPRRSILLPGNVSMNFVLIPPGSFRMGGPADENREADEDPFHHVKITRGYYLAVHPITQAQWNAMLSPLDYQFPGPHRPVEQVNWHETQTFCTCLSELTDEHFRLPTEAEWEYACRAGTSTAFSFGEIITTDLANYDGNYPYRQGPRGIYREETTPVDTFPANAWGLQDMHGNVWEWCQDWFDDEYYGQSPENDPPGAPEGTSRTVRGGSWYFGARPTRSSYRFWMDPNRRDDDLGFRVVLALR